jgi:hypothetical protein
MQVPYASDRMRTILRITMKKKNCQRNASSNKIICLLSKKKNRNHQKHFRLSILFFLYFDSKKKTNRRNRDEKKKKFDRNKKFNVTQFRKIPLVISRIEKKNIGECGRTKSRKKKSDQEFLECDSCLFYDSDRQLQ